MYIEKYYYKFPFRFALLLPFLAVLSTVFVVRHDMANGVVLGKYFWFYGSMGLVSVATLVRVLVSRRSVRFSAQDALVLLFAAAVYLPALLSGAPHNASKLTIFTLLIVLYFSFRLAVGTLKRKDAARHVFYLFIIFTGLVEAVWGMRQLYGFEASQHDLFKLTGSFFNPGPYAGYLAVVLPVALSCLLWRRESGQKEHGQKEHERQPRFCSALRALFSGLLFFVLPLAACLSVALTLPAAMSRASWLAAAAGSVAVVAFRYGGQIQQFCRRRKRQAWIAGCAVALFALAASAGMYFLKKDSADGRALTWKISLQTVAKHPFGVGLGNFSGAYGEAQAAYFASGQATETEQQVAGNPEYGFNEYLQVAVESGVTAFLLLVGIIVLAIRNTVRAKSWGALGSLVALLVFAGFSYPFSVLPFPVVLVFLLSASSEQRSAAPPTASRPALGAASSPHRPAGRWRLRPAVAGSMLLLLVTSACLWRQYPAYRACKQWQEQQVYYHAGLFEGSAESYEKLYPQLNDQLRFLFEYAQCLSKSGQPARSNRVLLRAAQISCDPMLYNVMGKNYQALREYGQAEACFTRAAHIVPSRLYPWYLLTKLYHEMGWPEKVNETAKIVLTKEPKVQSAAVQEIRKEVEELIGKR